MSAYLVAYFAKEDRTLYGTGARFLGLAILSEESPTTTDGRRTACVVRWPGKTYQEARNELITHLQTTAPWLLPEANK